MQRLSNWRQDTRYAVRRLKRSPGFTVAGVAFLALGIGVNTAVFSVVHATLIRSLPYRGPDRLCWVWGHESAPGVRSRRWCRWMTRLAG